MIALDLLAYRDHLTTRISGRREVYDPVRKKWVAMTPEESVRQLLISYLLDTGICSRARISVEKALEVNERWRRYDLVLFDQSGRPGMLVECKAPSIILDQKTLDQVALYNLTLKVPYLLVVNGWSAYCARIDHVAGGYWFIDQIPVIA